MSGKLINNVSADWTDVDYDTNNLYFVNTQSTVSIKNCVSDNENEEKPDICTEVEWNEFCKDLQLEDENKDDINLSHYLNTTGTTATFTVSA